MPSSVPPPRPSHQACSASAYRSAHHAKGYPATIIQRYLRENGQPDEAGIATLAAELQLPHSVVRSTLSYYTDYSDALTADQLICDGTSCFLSRQNKQDAGHAPTAAKHVSCLGHCNHENNQLINGSLHSSDTHTGTGRVTVGPTPIHCLAAQPVTTRNLIDGQSAKLATKPTTGISRSGYDVFRSALQQPPEQIIETITASGLRGRGGAAFPTGSKWQACATTEADQRYVIANGNEGDPGSYIDRILLEHDPHSIIEGMLLCGYAVGANKGIVFIRSEYPQAAKIMQRAIAEAHDAGIFRTENFRFDLSIVHGAGSFVCGEETALINAIEGLRGEVRLRPPYPTEAGLFGKPTVVDNVETLANVPFILAKGAESYLKMGTSASPGTKTLCFNHGFVKPGIVEVEFGTSIQQAIDAVGGSKEPLAAILLGGPMGCVLTPDQWHIPLCYQAMQERGLELGHGNIIALPKTADKVALIRHWLTFMAKESCGKCEPCSLGSKQSRQIASQAITADSRDQLEDLLQLISQTSLCSFGREIPRAVSQLLNLFQSEILTPEIITPKSS